MHNPSASSVRLQLKQQLCVTGTSGGGGGGRQLRTGKKTCIMHPSRTDERLCIRERGRFGSVLIMISAFLSVTWSTWMDERRRDWTTLKHSSVKAVHNSPVCVCVCPCPCLSIRVAQFSETSRGHKHWLSGHLWNHETQILFFCL